MNSEIASACQCFGLYAGESIVGFMGVLHQPHGTHKNIKRVSRLVILPDYQGIGLGTKFLEVVADYYASSGYDFSIVTSAKNFVIKLSKSEKWRLINIGVHKSSTQKNAIDYKRESIRKRAKTASFFYKRTHE